MEVDLEKLVSGAREFLKKRKEEKIGGDNVLCTTDEIMASLKDGATPVDINQELIEKKVYLHKISYKNITFVNVTAAPVKKLEKYSKSK
jgi:hypothetical protein